jgi:hypothetical protein
MPAKAGIQESLVSAALAAATPTLLARLGWRAAAARASKCSWMPAFAGMTGW